MDAVIWMILILLLILVNWAAVHLKTINKLHFVWSGLIIAILGPIMAFILGALFVHFDHSQGSTGEGGAIAAAFIGLILIGNGFIYFLIGFILKIFDYFKSIRS